MSWLSDRIGKDPTKKLREAVQHVADHPESLILGPGQMATEALAAEGMRQLAPEEQGLGAGGIPEAPDLGDEDVLAARRRAYRRGAGGRQSTMLTGGAGLMGSLPRLGSVTLLGR